MLVTSGASAVVATPLGPIGFSPFLNDVLAFSLPIPNAWIWPVGWLIVVVLLRMAWRADASERFALSMILVGAVSNLIDRMVLGGVVDYVSFTRFFPAFNIADLLILAGIMRWAWIGRRLFRNQA